MEINPNTKILNSKQYLNRKFPGSKQWLFLLWICLEFSASDFEFKCAKESIVSLTLFLDGPKVKGGVL